MNRLINVPELSQWASDLRGGLQAAAVALPMGLAFGVVSGFGPVAGLWGAICTGVLTALFGGTATQISGPTGPIAIVMASVAVTFAQQPAAIVCVVVLAGLLQIVFGALRLGKYISLMPFPVTSGFATAVGCIIIVMQLNPLAGMPPASDTVAAVLSFAAQLDMFDPRTAATAFACLAVCHWMPSRLRAVVPVHLSVLVAGTAVVAIAGIDVPTLDRPASLLPSPTLVRTLDLPWVQIALSATILSLVSSLDSLLTSLAADNATHSFHDSNRELVGQGIGNVVAGGIGALPGAGSTFRTMANIRGGGCTPLSAIAHAAVLLVLVLAGGHLIRFIPSSVLAGILIYIGLGIVDWRYIRRFLVVPRSGVFVMITTWIVALFINVVTGAVVGIVLASLLFVKRMADIQLGELGELDDDEEPLTSRALSASDRAALDASDGATLLIRLGGPLAFGAANGLVKRVANLSGYRVLVLDFTDVPDIDESGVFAFENVVNAAREHGLAVFVSGLRRAVARPILSFGLESTLRSCQRFRERGEALRAAADLVKNESQSKEQ